MRYLPLDAANGEVHLGEPPSGVVGFLPVDRYIRSRPAAVAVSGLVRAYELHGLHEHAGRTATGVIDAPVVGLQHLDQQPYDAARSVELAAPASLGKRELREEVFIDPAQHILSARLCVAHPDVADEVDDLSEPRLVKRRARVFLWQHVFERRVVALYRLHRVVHDASYGGLTRVVPQVRPSGFTRHPEYAVGAVLLRVFRVCVFALYQFLKARMRLLEGIGDVLQEYEAENDVLVLGSVHTAAQRVRHAPEFGVVVGEVGGRFGRRRGLGCGHCGDLRICGMLATMIA